VAWAGGLVDWNSQYMLNGYYYALVSEVKVQCYNPPSGFSNNHGSKAYYYDNSYGTNDTVATGNNSTELASFFATGDNPSVNPNAAASGTAAAPKNSATPETVPGVSGGGAAGIGGTDSSGNAQSGTAAGSAQGSQSSAGSGGSTTFQQGLGSSGTSQAPPKLAAGSAVALLGFFVACLLL